MKLTNTKDRELGTIKALVHGDSGIGKTTSLTTLPEDKTVIAMMERGALPLRKHDYVVVALEEWEDAKALYAALAHPKECKNQELLAALKGKSVLAIDSLSELSVLCQKQIVTVDRKRLQSERTGGKKDTPDSVYEDQMTMEDWGLYRTRMNNMLSAFCHLPIHVIMTAISGWGKDKQGGDIYRTPNLSGKLAYECPAHFDLVLHMESTGEGEEERRVWRTYNDGEIIAKDASGVLDRFEETNWTKLFTKILKGESKDG
jgi:hypothetical protein